MKKLLVSAAAVLATVVAFGMVSPDSASADGSHTYHDGYCNGETASISVSWSPAAGAIEQWVEVSLYQGFGSTYSAKGPYAPSVTSAEWDDLDSGYTYFWRVKTLTSYGWVYSPVYSFTPCAGSPYYYPVYPVYANACYGYLPYNDTQALYQQGIAYHLSLFGNAYYPYPYYGYGNYCAAAYINSYFYHQCAPAYYPGNCYIWSPGH